MCTLVFAYRPDADWPVLLAANRDEKIGRPALPPGRHWDNRPQVVAGKDIEGGGTWLGLNDAGVVAGILNRSGTLGPAAGKRSRGEIVLRTLDYADATTAARALDELATQAYRPFNLVVADSREAFWLRSLGTGAIERWRLPPGISMITAHDRNDTRSHRIRTYLPLFQAAPLPDPDKDHWATWKALLASRDRAADDGLEESAMTIADRDGFGTVSSALIALPAAGKEGPPVFRFADGRPDETLFENVAV